MRVAEAVLLLFFSLCFVSDLKPLQAAEKPDRQVAITIDDLPAGASNTMSAAEITDMTSKLLTTLRDQKVPAVGFVNEKKLYPGDYMRAEAGSVDHRVWSDTGCTCVLLTSIEDMIL